MEKTSKSDTPGGAGGGEAARRGDGAEPAHPTRREFLAWVSVLAVQAGGPRPARGAARGPAPPDAERGSRTPAFLSPAGIPPEGRCVITPDHGLAARTYVTMQVTFVVGSAGVAHGGAFRFVIPPGMPVDRWWSLPQVEDPIGEGYCTATWRSSGQARILLRPIHRGLQLVVAEGNLAEGDSVELKYGDTSFGSPGAAVQASGDSASVFHVTVDPGGRGNYRAFGMSPAVETIAADPIELSLVAPSYAAVGEPFRLRIVALDPCRNASPFQGTIGLEADGGPDAVDFPQTVSMRGSDRGILLVNVVARKPGVLRIRAAAVWGGGGAPGSRSPAAGIAGESNPTFVRERLPAERLFWGDIHGHTARSDGAGRPAVYYDYGREVAGLDFCALTEHDDMLDRPEWEESQRVTNQANHPGEFSTLVGYEWTHWALGHRNVYFRGASGVLFPWNRPGSTTARELWTSLRNARLEAITIPHHPRGLPRRKVDTGDFDWEHYTPDPSIEPLVEIFSIHGSSESEVTAGDERLAGRKGFVEEAIRLGVRLGLMASGDDHSGHPGLGPGLAHRQPGLAAVWAAKNTRDALWNALRRRRVYGTSGKRILIEFDCDGHAPGSEYETSRAPRISVRVWGTALLKRFVVRRDAIPIHDVEPADARDAEIECLDREALAGDHSYYVGVVQVDGHAAWAGPIWVRRLEGSAGSSSGRNGPQGPVG